MKQYTWIFIAIALFLIPAAVHAQTSVSFGPKAGIDLGDADDAFIGADARISSESLPVRINPVFNYYFSPEGVTRWSAGANALFDLAGLEEDISPYVGGGLQVYTTSFDFGGQSVSNSDLGLTAVGGAEFNLESIRPFVQAELGIIFSEGDSGTLFGIGGGVLFDL